MQCSFQHFSEIKSETFDLHIQNAHLTVQKMKKTYKRKTVLTTNEKPALLMITTFGSPQERFKPLL